MVVAPISLRLVKIPWSYRTYRTYRTYKSYPYCYCLFRGRQYDIPEPDLAMIALEHDRPGRPLGAVQGASGDSRRFFFVDHRLAVERDGQLAPDQSDLVFLPLAGLFRRV